MSELLCKGGGASSIRLDADVARGDDALLAFHGADDLCGELSTSVGHGEGRRARAALRLDDLVAAELDAVNERIVRFLGEACREGVR